MLDEAILRTVLYADIFHFPLTPTELTRFLIHQEAVTLSTIEFALKHSPRLQHDLWQQDGYVTLAHRREIIISRKQRELATNEVLPIALYYAKWLSRIPFVRMVALTGALAMRNPAHSGDDIDYLLVVEAGRVWMARAFSIMLVRWARLWHIELCPNYVLATNKLPQTRRDLYIAHEIAQMVPLYGYPIYESMLDANAWVTQWLPNTLAQPLTPQKSQNFLKRVIERCLSGYLGDRLEQWEYQRKSKRFARAVNSARASAQIDTQVVKGHFNDHGQRVLDQYHERLKAYELEPSTLQMVGD